MQFIRKLRQNTFMLGSCKYNPNEPNKLRKIYPSGTISSISDKEFIGSYHCLDKGHIHSAMNPNTSEKYRLKILETNNDRQRDMARFSIGGKKVRNSWIEMSSSFPKKGDNIYIYGYPKENGISLEKYIGKPIKAKVVFSGFFKELCHLGYILIFDKKVLKGHSGSPILNKQGLLVGVVKGEFDNVPKFKGCSIGICLKDDSPKKYLKNYR